jgi:hypothetical protein
MADYTGIKRIFKDIYFRMSYQVTYMSLSMVLEFTSILENLVTGVTRYDIFLIQIDVFWDLQMDS